MPRIEKEKKCPTCRAKMFYLPRGDCSIKGCKEITFSWYCLECGKEIPGN